MKLNHYETIYILKPDIKEENNLFLVNKCKSIIKQYGGQNICIQHRGRRHLTYNIQSYYDGIYVQINYAASSQLVKILEKALIFSNDVIRYLTIKQL
uniref:Small ribosomal subunit protein bS6c n=1 Tax=Gracilariopsis heteroclada TaxID=172978 RepID=A0A344V6F1_9FLOR|nr:ribosomal protein S6 [Gracilariopsis heteroclada]AXE43538.1 ribosomal protein S6 [Gracilariopsis heteroclada]